MTRTGWSGSITARVGGQLSGPRVSGLSVRAPGGSGCGSGRERPGTPAVGLSQRFPAKGHSWVPDAPTAPQRRECQASERQAGTSVPWATSPSASRLGDPSGQRHRSGEQVPRPHLGAPGPGPVHRGLGSLARSSEHLVSADAWCSPEIPLTTRASRHSEGAAGTSLTSP